MTFAQLALFGGIAAFAVVAIFVVAIKILQRNDRASLKASVRRQMADVERARDRKIGVARSGR